VSTSALVVFALALIVAAGSPGPSVAALVARVLARGMRDVLPFLAAMWLGEAMWLSFAVAGLAIVAKTFATLFTIARFLGVGYLLFLAWRMWTAPTEIAGDALPDSRKPWRMFLAGMLVTLGNPKIMVFYLALLPTIVDLSRVNAGDWAELTLTMLVILVVVDVGWALVAAQARRLFADQRAVRIANRAGATVMAGAAAAIATR
jgi:threonine/homoserine/homoserine lactone efflux protein